jgi:prevent-host-death family protein
MLKIISVSDLRVQIKRVLNEVGYGQSEYLVKKFGEPTAAIISIKDFNLLQKVKQQQQQGDADQATASFLQDLKAIHQSLQKSGYRFRSKEDIDAQIQIERESWGT